MPEEIKPQQQSLFPTRESLQDVIAEGKAQLPITNENDLVALLQLQQNTIIKLMGNAA